MLNNENTIKTTAKKIHKQLHISIGVLTIQSYRKIL